MKEKAHQLKESASKKIHNVKAHIKGDSEIEEI